jgi:hypothetical protein
MGVIAQLASEMKNRTSRNPKTLDVSEWIDLYTLLATAACMLEKLQEDNDKLTEKLDTILLHPPRIIDAMPPGTTFMP